MSRTWVGEDGKVRIELPHTDFMRRQKNWEQLASLRPHETHDCPVYKETGMTFGCEPCGLFFDLWFSGVQYKITDELVVIPENAESLK